MFLANKEKINIKYFMMGYLSLLLILSSVFLDSIVYLWRGIIIVAIYLGFDLFISRLRNESWYFPSSSIISGLVLSLVGILDGFYPFFLPIIAVISKQILHFGRFRHVFNPAAFALAFVSIFIPTVSWWGVTILDISKHSSSFNYILLFTIIISGLFILYRQNKWLVAAAFLFSYLLFSFFLSLMMGAPLIFNLWEVLSRQIFGGGVIFFTTVMLVEPVTSTFSLVREEGFYGFLVGFFSVLMIYLSGIFHIGRLDYLVFGLVIGDLAASLLFLSPISKKISISKK